MGKKKPNRKSSTHPSSPAVTAKLLASPAETPSPSSVATALTSATAACGDLSMAIAASTPTNQHLLAEASSTKSQGPAAVPSSPTKLVAVASPSNQSSPANLDSSPPHKCSSGALESSLMEVEGTPVTSSPNHTTIPVSKPTWCDLVQGKKKKLAKKGESFLLDSGEICVKIPNDVIKRNLHKWDDFIIGQFQGNTPSPGAMHAITNGIWSSRQRNISVSKISDRAFLIKIPCPATRRRVLAQGLWFIDKQAMFVAKWKPRVLPETPELTSTPVWVDFKNIPLHFYSEEGLEYIAGLVGEPLFLHPQTANMSNLTVARVFTLIDPRKTLHEVVNVQFDSGQVHKIDVSCPWFPPVCDHCKEIGHTLKCCPSVPVTCEDCKSTSHDVVHCPRKKKPLKASEGNLDEVKPVQTKQTRSETIVIASTPLDGQQIVNSGLETKSLTTETEGNDQGKLSTLLVQMEQGSTSKSIRSRRRLPLYFTSSGPAVFSSETDIFSSETESSYNYSDEEEFPPLSERFKKVEAQRDKKPLKK